MNYEIKIIQSMFIDCNCYLISKELHIKSMNVYNLSLEINIKSEY